MARDVNGKGEIYYYEVWFNPWILISLDLKLLYDEIQLGKNVKLWWTKNENIEKIKKARGLAQAFLARAYDPRPEASPARDRAVKKACGKSPNK